MTVATAPPVMAGAQGDAVPVRHGIAVEGGETESQAEGGHMASIGR